MVAGFDQVVSCVDAGDGLVLPVVTGDDTLLEKAA